MQQHHAAISKSSAPCVRRMPSSPKPLTVDSYAQEQTLMVEGSKQPFLARIASHWGALTCDMPLLRHVPPQIAEDLPRGAQKMVTFHPIRPCDLPLWDLAHSGYVDRLTPNDYPVAHAGETDLTYYGMMMGGLPNFAEKKMAALSILSKLSNESIGLVGVHRFDEDGYIQPHTGAHLTFFYVQGGTAVANVMKWSKCLLVCEDEIVVVLNSEGQPEKAEKILRTIIPAHPDGTPFHKMGHPCPIEYKGNAPKRRAPRPILP